MSRALNSKYTKTFFNTIMLYLLAIAKILFPLVTLPYLTRVLSLEAYGAVSYVKSIVAYAQTAIDFGFILSSVRDIVNANREKELTARVVGNTIVAKLMLAVAAFVAILILAFVVPTLRDYKVLLLLSFITPLLSCFLLDFFFRGVERMHIVSVIYVSMKAISTVLTVILIKGDEHLLLIPVFDAISSLVAISITWCIYKRTGFGVKFDGIKGAIRKIRESFFFFANSAASNVFGALTTAIIGICITDLREVAYWSVSIQLVGAIQLMYAPLSQGVYPHMIKSKDLSLIRKILYVFVPLVCLGSIIAAFISPTLLSIVGGEDYRDASTVFRCLLPVLIISFPVAILGWPTLGAIGKTKQINIATLSGALAQLASLAALYIFNSFTIVNVAIMRNLSELVMFGVLLAFTMKYRKMFSLKVSGEAVLDESEKSS